MVRDGVRETCSGDIHERGASFNWANDCAAYRSSVIFLAKFQRIKGGRDQNRNEVVGKRNKDFAGFVPDGGTKM